MKKIMNNNGVTLIALIVTIIVLIILAGITLNATLGDEGLLQRTNEASLASDFENVSNKLKGITANYQSQQSSGEFSGSLIDYLMDRDIINYSGEGNKWIINTERLLGQKQATGNGTTTDIYVLELEADLKYNIYYYGETASDKTLIGTIKDLDEDNVTSTELTNINDTGAFYLESEEPNPIPDPIEGEPENLFAEDVSNNPNKYIGAIVNYNVPISTSLNNHWRIFYADDSNIFLITDSYVNFSYLPNSNAEITSTGTYSAKWANKPSVQNVSMDLKDSFLYRLCTDYSSGGGRNAVSTMLNTSNWTSFVNSDYADYSIGGPTIEMFVASWEAKGYESIPYSTNSYGYTFELNNSQYARYQTNLGATNGYNDDLYFPEPGSSTHANGYYFSSPGGNYADDQGYYDDYICVTTKIGYISNILYNNYGSAGNTGFRPIVRLKSNIKLEPNTTDNTIDYDLVIMR